MDIRSQVFRIIRRFTYTRIIYEFVFRCAYPGGFLHTNAETFGVGNHGIDYRDIPAGVFVRVLVLQLGCGNIYDSDVFSYVDSIFPDK